VTIYVKSRRGGVGLLLIALVTLVGVNCEKYAGDTSSKREKGGVEAVRDGGWWGESMTTGPRQGYTGKGRDEVY
jgi:hypothetical protein